MTTTTIQAERQFSPAQGERQVFPAMAAALPLADAPVGTIAVDAEEDFDWLHPARGTDYSTGCMKNVRTLQEIAGAYACVPTYLLTYPVLEDIEVVRILRRQIDRGECDVGVQLHPWVTPPFDDTPNPGASFPGNLDPVTEERKLVAMIGRFRECFGTEPRIYRAGRYGLGAHSAEMLERLAFSIDLSLAPRTSFADEDGPDYTDYDCAPFWFGHRERLLELPLCRSVVGWSGPLAAPLYRNLSSPRMARFRALGLLTRSRCVERITLSPEGNDLAAMIRLVRQLHAAGQRIFVVSFHSSSLAVGRNPYVRTKAELHGFYDRLSGILNFIADLPGARFASLAQVPGLLSAPSM